MVTHSLMTVSSCVCVCNYCSHIHPNSGLMIKLDLQLYQIDTKNYLLDFKCVNPGKPHPSVCVYCMPLLSTVHVLL